MKLALGHARRTDGATVNHRPFFAAGQPAGDGQHDPARFGEKRGERQQTRQLDAVQVALDLWDTAASSVWLNNKPTTSQVASWTGTVHLFGKTCMQHIRTTNE